MGKGDKKTKKGKINQGSYGVKRPRKKSTTAVTISKPVEIKNDIQRIEKPVKEKEVVEKVQAVETLEVNEVPAAAETQVEKDKAEEVAVAEKPKKTTKKAAPKEKAEEEEKPKAKKTTKKKED